MSQNSEGGLAGTEPSVCRADILVCRFTELSSSVSGDWKVARTDRLESLPHTTDSVPTSEFGMSMSPTSKRAHRAQIYDRYQRAGRPHQSLILGEF
jgi:hypothetical protein